MPPRIAPRGVEFIEFAASHEEAEDFGRVFRALGFAPVGQHRSKDVTRWAQGGINLVVNSEPEGLAHSFDMVHGGSVCAIGLAVPDQQAALDRAQALDIPRFAQPVGPDEWEIPSLRGVGAACSIWSMLIRARPCGPMNSPAHWNRPLQAIALRVDHIAQTMQYEEMLSWLLYYHALLDVKKTPQLEIADPMGLVYSQAVETADGALRFTLNGSMAVQSLSSRFIQAYFGAGVQHIAFATDDVFAAAQAAADAGLPMLDIGPNYYEDLEAKYASILNCWRGWSD
jgi:4-hydroxyphenylpyruvate dioxygenase